MTLIGQSNTAFSSSLLKPKIEVDSLAGVQGAEQRGELGWRGSVCKGGQASRKPQARGQPRAHRAQQARPARQRLGAAGFFPLQVVLAVGANAVLIQATDFN